MSTHQLQPHTYYHLYNRAHGNEQLFKEQENYRFFLSRWAKYVEPIASTYAYCLMPNHIHFLIRTRDEEQLLAFFKRENHLLSKAMSQQLGNLFNSYTKAFNKRYDRMGSLWMRPFKAKEIDSEEYLRNVIFYIHHNPIHHGFRQRIEDWPHSSFQALITKGKTKVMREAVHRCYGSKAELRRFHEQVIGPLRPLEDELT